MSIKYKIDIALFAPNVRSGGGIKLLTHLIGAISKNNNCCYFLNTNTKYLFEKMLYSQTVIWCESSFLGRLKAEFLILKYTKHSKLIFSFNNHKPFLVWRSNIFVYLHNVFVIDTYNFGKGYFQKKTMSFLETALFYLTVISDAKIIVQTPTMLEILVKKFAWRRGIVSRTRLFPFTGPLDMDAKPRKDPPEWDYFYPAADVPHKNHLNLIQAWILLKNEGVEKSLVLTIKKDSEVGTIVMGLVDKHSLNVKNIGWADDAKMAYIYSSSKSLIYPSFNESFGLPLIEASQIGMDIIAAERDYVRNICSPKETFDPTSALSISRAVLRHCNHEVRTINIMDPTDIFKIFDEESKSKFMDKASRVL